VLIVGAMIVVVVALVVVLSSSGGGSSPGQGAASVSSSTTQAHTRTHRQRTSSHQGAGSSAAASPGETSVTVLNGTSTNGLAHGLSKNLQQSGYTQAAALGGTPPGSHATTLVEYTSGHRAEAQGVASALGVAQVQPLETAVASIAGPAAVVVIAGEDKAASVP